MKNLSLILNVVLGVAVAVLYYLHFSGHSSTANDTKEVTITAPVKGGAPASIAYVNSDTLLSKYDYYKKMSSDFEAKQARVENDLMQKEQAIRNEIASYQQKAQSMTEMELRGLQEKFARDEQAFMQYKERKIKELTDEQQKQNEILYNKVTDFLKNHSQNKFRYVLSYSKTGSILFADDSLDITKQVIDGLNQEFETSKKKK